jgi:hypothetical protein
MNAKCNSERSRNTPKPTLPVMIPPLHLLSVALGHTLQLVLLLDSVRVAGTLGSVDQLLSKALSNGLDVAERGLAGTSGEEGDSLVDSAEGRDIDGLSSDGTGGTNSGRVFTRTTVDDSVDGDLDRVLVGHEVDLALMLAPFVIAKKKY